MVIIPWVATTPGLQGHENFVPENPLMDLWSFLLFYNAIHKIKTLCCLLSAAKILSIRLLTVVRDTIAIM